MISLMDIKPSIRHFGSNRSLDPGFVTDGTILLLTQYMSRWKDMMGKRLLKKDKELAEYSASWGADHHMIQSIMPSTQEIHDAVDIYYATLLKPRDKGSDIYEAVFSAPDRPQQWLFNAGVIRLLHHVIGPDIALKGFDTQRSALIYTQVDGDFAGLVMPLRPRD